MPHVEQDSMATVLGFIGGEWLTNRFLAQFKIPASGKMWMKMMLGGLILYAAEEEQQFFLSSVGVGAFASGVYDYLRMQGYLASAGETDIPMITLPVEEAVLLSPDEYVIVGEM